MTIPITTPSSAKVTPFAERVERASAAFDQKIRVSIILPTCNRLKYLRPAAESVFSQTFQGWELIVADDGSDADTQAYLKTLSGLPRVKVMLLSHTGNPGTVRNAALREAKGDYIAFLDSDDLWLPLKLATQIKALDGSTRRWSYTAFNRIDESGNQVIDRNVRQWLPYEGAIFEQILRMEALIAMPTVVAERRLIEEAGGFDAGQVQHGDYELWLRLILRSEVLLIDTPLACVRTHREHYTHGGVWALEWKRRLFEKAQGLVVDPNLLAAVRMARAGNAAQLANAYAASGKRAAALQILSRSLRPSWRYAEWWAGALKTLLRSLAPWMVAGYSLYRKRARGTRSSTGVSISSPDGQAIISPTCAPNRTAHEDRPGRTGRR
jgi:glycosyltransferase involved in cell wall biosynthesis